MSKEFKHTCSHNSSMNLAQPLSSFDARGIFLSDPIKNTVMPNSNFTRVLYSDPNVTFAGIHLQLSFPVLTEERYFQKSRLVFDTQKYAHLVQTVQKIETIILDSFGSKKRRVSKMSDQFSQGTLRMGHSLLGEDIARDYVLKISGVWETEYDYGLTFKVMEVNRR